MDQSAVQMEDQNAAFCHLVFREERELEHKRQNLQDERKKFEEEKRKFEKEKREFSIKKRIEEQKIDQENKLFEMKWKILKDELKKLAAEKEQVARQRDFYRYVMDYEGDSRKDSSRVVRGEMFFCGVNNEAALKKRYTDLIKIYHPDNLCGDKRTIQEINSEYEKLKLQFG